MNRSRSRRKRIPKKSLLSYILLGSCIFIGLNTPVFAQSENLKQAIQFYDKGDYASVLDKLSDPDKLGGDVYRAKYYRGLAYQKLKQKKLATSEFKWLYYNSKDKTVQYKAWQALRGMQSTPLVGSVQATENKAAHLKAGPGADAWVTPTEGYGRSGPAAYSRLKVQRYAKPCGH